MGLKVFQVFTDVIKEPYLKVTRCLVFNWVGNVTLHQRQRKPITFMEYPVSAQTTGPEGYCVKRFTRQVCYLVSTNLIFSDAYAYIFYHPYHNPVFYFLKVNHAPTKGSPLTMWLKTKEKIWGIQILDNVSQKISSPVAE